MNYILRRDNIGANCFLITDQFPAISLIKNTEPLPEADYVVRWGTTSNVPGKPKIINSAKAIHETSAKGHFRKKVADAGFAPRTWMNIIEYINAVGDGGLDIPVIVRPTLHERSENLHYCTTIGQTAAAVAQCNGDYYISEYIKKDKEYRAFIANGRVIILIEKETKDKDAISWGCVDEGVFDYIYWEDWPESVVRCAIESFNLSGLEFAAIDVIMKDDQAYFLEANTAPELGPYYAKCLGKALTWMMDGDKRARIPATGYDDWKKCIHPAISPRAIVN